VAAGGGAGRAPGVGPQLVEELATLRG